MTSQRVTKSTLIQQTKKKAKVQVYLSCNRESDSRIGISMKNGIINTADNCFDEIKDFISKI